MPRRRPSITAALLEASAANCGEAITLPSDVIDFPKRGRRMNADEIAEEFYGRHVSAEWVDEHVAYRVRVSYRVVLWWEFDVRVHLEEERRRALAGEPPYTRRDREKARAA